MPDRLPFVVEPMAVSDLGEVMVIERLSFSSPWSERAYRFEIEKNENGVMLVVRRAYRSNTWLSQVLRRLTNPPAKPPAGLEHAGGSGGSQVLGYGGLWLLVDEAHISTIAVHPQWRGTGLGERLLLSLLEQGAKRGMQRATLEVRVSNEAAQGLYHKLGFEIAGRQKRYYSDNNEDAFILVTPPFDTPGFQDNLRRCRAELHARLRADNADPTSGRQGTAQVGAYQLDKPPQLG